MSLRSIVSCGLCLALGLIPGGLLLAIGLPAQGVGVLLLGGLIGLAIGVSSVIYDITPWETLSRALSGALGVVIGYNLPIDTEAFNPSHDPKCRRAQPETAWDPLKVDLRFELGLKLGALLGALAGIPLFFVIPEGNDEDSLEWLGPLRPLVYLVLVAFLTMIVGGVWGSGLGLLSARGPHRGKVLLGLLGGAAIGAALATGVLWDARPPIFGQFVGFVGFVATLGLGAGVLSSETTDSNNGSGRS